MDVTTLLSNFFSNSESLKSLGNHVGVETIKTQELAKLGIQEMLKSINQNVSSQQGAEAFMEALEQHQGDSLSDLEQSINQADPKDGRKILHHVFHTTNDTIQKNLADKTGLDLEQVNRILSQLAPVVLGVLGQQKKQFNLDVYGISGLLSIAGSYFDSDQTNNPSDIGNLLNNFFK
jgi:hypothetical protein